MFGRHLIAQAVLAASAAACSGCGSACGQHGAPLDPVKFVESISDAELDAMDEESADSLDNLDTDSIEGDEDAMGGNFDFLQQLMGGGDGDMDIEALLKQMGGMDGEMGDLLKQLGGMGDMMGDMGNEGMCGADDGMCCANGMCGMEPPAMNGTSTNSLDDLKAEFDGNQQCGMMCQAQKYVNETFASFNSTGAGEQQDDLDSDFDEL